MRERLPLQKRPRRPLIGWCGVVVAALFAALCWSGSALGQAAASPATAPATEPATQPAAAAAAPWLGKDVDTGSTAWMLVSSALVLFMVPGLALFYGGMVRAKNVLNMFLCCMVTIGVMGLIWVIYGYAIAFPTVGGPTTISLITSGVNPDAGNAPISWLAFDPSLLFLKSFNADWGRILVSGDTNVKDQVATGIPELAFVMFQGKFFIITPALIVGAVAERVRFGPFILFTIIWSTVVYLPIAHWVWNVNGWLFQRGVFDFAGGTVVHVLAGVSSLAVCLVVGPRTGYGKVAMPPHSLGLTLIGAGLLWFGWFGFNAGSAVAVGAADLPVSGKVAALAFANTQVAAAATAWMCVEWVHAGKPTILGFASGMVAGLVLITPCAGYVLPWSSIVIGGAGAVVCYFACRLKGVFGYDDSLDAFGVHGVGGALGALLVGVFAIRPLTVAGATPGGMDQFLKQLLGVSVAAVFCFVLSFVIAKAIAMTIGLRAKIDDEVEGLDISLHGESGYHLSMTDMEGYVTADGTPDARGTGVVAKA